MFHYASFGFGRQKRKARCVTAQDIEMVQTRRRARQRGAALLRLPTDDADY